MTQVGISNSEVQNALCEHAWGYGHHPESNLQKKEQGLARTRGITGHSALQRYYECLRDGETSDFAASEALDLVHDLRVKEIMNGDFQDEDRLAMLNWLHRTLTKYFEYYEDDVKNFEILEVEAFHAQEMEDESDFYLPSRLDVTVYHKAGDFKGETSPLDHKFTYDFWPSYKLTLNSQFPLYILALRAARFPGKPKPVVRRVIVNQIRTRDLKTPRNEDLFRRTYQSYTSEKIANVFENHMKAAVKLAYYKRLPWDEFLAEAKAALGSQACQYCDFKDLCDANFEDRDPAMTIAALYEKNDYGYPSLEVMRSERA